MNSTQAETLAAQPKKPQCCLRGQCCFPVHPSRSKTNSPALQGSRRQWQAQAESPAHVLGCQQITTSSSSACYRPLLGSKDWRPSVKLQRASGAQPAPSQPPSPGQGFHDLLPTLGHNGLVLGSTTGTCHSHPRLCCKYSSASETLRGGVAQWGKQSALEETSQKHHQHTTAALLNPEGGFILFALSSAEKIIAKWDGNHPASRAQHG